ncbi:MAG: thioesterase family protein [Candidatus Omnitrophota bacterium]|nr:acyl-CoA thioesterase [Candidatus Omnitrophota bacterium]
MEHSIELRVRYKETDQMGVVYYSNYLVWFEIARTEFFRANGIVYKNIEDDQNIYLPVVESYCRYKAPLRYDDLVTVVVRLTNLSGTRMAFDYEVFGNGKLCAMGWTKHAFVNEKGKPIQIPSAILSVFKIQTNDLPTRSSTL